MLLDALQRARHGWPAAAQRARESPRARAARSLARPTTPRAGMRPRFRSCQVSTKGLRTRGSWTLQRRPSLVATQVLRRAPRAPSRADPDRPSPRGAPPADVATRRLSAIPARRHRIGPPAHARPIGANQSALGTVERLHLAARGGTASSTPTITIGKARRVQRRSGSERSAG